MATNDSYFSSKDKNLANDSSKDQYSNFNLNNQNQKGLYNEDFKSGTNYSKNGQSHKLKTNDDFQFTKGSNPWNKPNKYLSLQLLNDENFYNPGKKSKSSTSSNSLNRSINNISIYENSIESTPENLDGKEDLTKKDEKPSMLKKLKGAKQFFIGSSSLAQNPFEFPRQQENEDSKIPEVTQFKASQKLLNPNTMHQSSPQPSPAEGETAPPSIAEGETPPPQSEPESEEPREIPSMDELLKSDDKRLPDIGEKIKTLKDEITVKRLIGRGGYGAVFEVENSAGTRLAMKVSKNPAAETTIEKEVIVLQACSHMLSKYFYQLVDHGKIDGRFSYIIMTLAGADLSQICILDGTQKMGLGVALILARETFNAIKLFHLAGFYHRDIKAQNFGTYKTGIDQRPQVALHDFGSAIKKSDVSEVHPTEVMPGFPPTEKDDILSWYFMMIHWFPKTSKSVSSNDTSSSSKENAIQELCESDEDEEKDIFSNLPPVMEEIYDYIRSLKVGDQLSHDYILSNLNVEINKLSRDTIIDWEADIYDIFCIDMSKAYYKRSSHGLHFNIHIGGYVFNFNKDGILKQFVCNATGCNSGFSVSNYNEKNLKNFQEAHLNGRPSKHNCINKLAKKLEAERQTQQHFIPLEMGQIIIADSKSKYEIVKAIKETRSGGIYEVKDKDGFLFALKVTINGEEDDMSELNIYESLVKVSSFHFTRLFDKLMDSEQTYLFITLVGKNLHDLQSLETSGHFSLESSLTLAKESLKGIYDLRLAGYVHGKVESSNFCIGRNGTKEHDSLFLLDLSTCSKIDPKIRNGEKADLIRWFFMITSWIASPPWKDEKDALKVMQMQEEINQKKSEISQAFFKDLPRNFFAIFAYITSLKMGEAPEYGYIFDSLKLSCEVLNISSSIITINGEEVNFSLMMFDISKPFFFITDQKKQFKVMHDFQTFLFKCFQNKGAVFRCKNQPKGCQKKLLVQEYDSKTARNGFEADASVLDKVEGHPLCGLKEDETAKNREKYTAMAKKHEYPTML
uniref:Protein kinase domain-containing protein n=1 Tax=Panagrolaimus sp. ES5 TaxID=591445 RepID=A0AC34FBU8_9BILA